MSALAQLSPVATANPADPKRCHAEKITLSVRETLMAQVSTFAKHSAPATWAPAHAENIPRLEKKADIPLNADNRAILAQLQAKVLEFNADIRPLLMAIGFREIDNLSMAPLMHLLNSNGGALAELNRRFDIDTAARMKALRPAQAVRGEDRRAA